MIVHSEIHMTCMLEKKVDFSLQYAAIAVAFFIP